ncbi:uncharacterized protein LOC132403627 [Hypanus sabinus]|uniref:uncharacterized protein LOC132403627 n=1 Tax=Hypanus sabinus TaxID=79690 RepID=UPI0028C4506A|nr:uncharacterized protein LOC132403627 [Hypanus sabinus]
MQQNWSSLLADWMEEKALAILPSCPFMVMDLVLMWKRSAQPLGWNVIQGRVPVTGTISKQKADEVGARCASIVLKKCGGHPGSAELWSLLRENSEAKLALMDAKMSNTFKSVFSIYTRDLQMKQEPQLHLDCLRDDWEEDFQKLPRAQFHKSASHVHNCLGLMKRASTINKDRATVIIANNPLADLNDLDGKDTPMRFLSKNPSKLKHPLRKHLTLPPLKDGKCRPSSIPKQEEKGTCQEKTLPTTKKESFASLSKRKDCRKIRMPTYLQSPKSMAKSSTSKECILGDSIVISISDGVGECGGPSANQF